MKKFEIEAEVIGNSRKVPRSFEFSVLAASTAEATAKAEEIAMSRFWDDGGQGDDPQILWLTIDGESVI